MWVTRAEARQEIAVDIKHKFWRAVAGIGLAVAGAIGVDVGISAALTHTSTIATERLTDHLMPDSAKRPQPSLSPAPEPIPYKTKLAGVNYDEHPSAAEKPTTITGLKEDQALPAGILIVGSLTGLAGLWAKRRQANRDRTYRQYDDYAELEVRNYVNPHILQAANLSIQWAILYTQAEESQPAQDNQAAIIETWLAESDAENKSYLLHRDAILQHPVNVSHVNVLTALGLDLPNAQQRVLAYSAL
ncbi:MAG TPA: hypothetical protein VMR45_01840 [Patescibacteria group bacterium]|nr:hypothetical protein [Patescibacteria group bacterium]